MDKKEENIISEYIISCKENCYCSLFSGKCGNCHSKEAILELYNKLKGN